MLVVEGVVDDVVAMVGVVVDDVVVMVGVVVDDVVVMVGVVVDDVVVMVRVVADDAALVVVVSYMEGNWVVPGTQGGAKSGQLHAPVLGSKYRPGGQLVSKIRPKTKTIVC